MERLLACKTVTVRVQFPQLHVYKRLAGKLRVTKAKDGPDGPTKKQKTLERRRHSFTRLEGSVGSKN